MSQYQRILYVTEHSEPDAPGLLRAMNLAAASGAALHVCLLAEGGASSAADAATASQAMHEQAARLGHPLAISVEAVGGPHEAREILVHAAESGAGLVVRPVDPETLLTRLLQERLDWQLLRDCPVPLLLVHGTASAVPKRILAAVDIKDDPSFNRRIVDHALALAIQCDAELHLAYAFDQQHALEALPPLVTTLSAEQYEALSDESRAAFAAFASDYGVPHSHRHFLLGRAVEVLPDFARKLQADVLALGAVRRRGFDRMLGSTPKALLDELSCDLLAIRRDP